MAREMLSKLILQEELSTHLLYEELEQRRDSYCDLILPKKQPPVEKAIFNINMTTQLV